MRDVLIKEGAKTYLIEDIEGVETIKRLKDFLPIDRVITIDANNYVYLYDRCFQIQEEDIEEVLND
jgi:hypothetical protein